MPSRQTQWRTTSDETHECTVVEISEGVLTSGCAGSPSSVLFPHEPKSVVTELLFSRTTESVRPGVRLLSMSPCAYAETSGLMNPAVDDAVRTSARVPGLGDAKERRGRAKAREVKIACISAKANSDEMQMEGETNADPPGLRRSIYSQPRPIATAQVLSILTRRRAAENAVVSL